MTDDEHQRQDDRDLSPSEATQQASSSTFGRDLLGPGPGWPFGKAAKARRQRRAEIADTARKRRAGLRDSVLRPAAATPSPGARGRRNAASPAQRAGVLGGIAAVVALLMGLSWWATTDDETPSAAPEPPAAPPVEPSTSVEDPPSAEPTAPAPGLNPVEPIPPDGVAPITPPPPRVLDPNAVPVAPAPEQPPSASELASPEQAAVAWMARWCPFDYRQPYGTSQNAARPAMTELGWESFDPAGSDRGRASWDKTVAAGEVGQCSTPIAEVSPEAPRSAASAIVIVSADRVVTGRDATPYVEELTETRIVQRDETGQWRVDTATRGG